MIYIYNLPLDNYVYLNYKMNYVLYIFVFELIFIFAVTINFFY